MAVVVRKTVHVPRHFYFHLLFLFSLCTHEQVTHPSRSWFLQPGDSSRSFVVDGRGERSTAESHHLRQNQSKDESSFSWSSSRQVIFEPLHPIWMPLCPISVLESERVSVWRFVSGGVPEVFYIWTADQRVLFYSGFSSELMAAHLWCLCNTAAHTWTLWQCFYNVAAHTVLI